MRPIEDIGTDLQAWARRIRTCLEGLTLGEALGEADDA